jgi:hypothetical protein
MTEQQIKNLRTAIENAKNAGACAYVRNGEPDCVIGQLGFLEGVSGDQLDSWHGPVDLIISNPDGLYEKSEVLKSYDEDLLCSLQSIWDSHSMNIEDEAVEGLRRLMNERVDNFINQPTNA